MWQVPDKSDLILAYHYSYIYCGQKVKWWVCEVPGAVLAAWKQMHTRVKLKFQFPLLPFWLVRGMVLPEI